MSLTKTLAGALVAAGIAVAAWPAGAEKAQMSPDALRKTATHVVVGTVKAVYTRAADEGSYRVTRYVAEVEVRDVEKGDGLEKGQLAYVRYWTRAWRGAGGMPPGTTGHRGLPSEDQTLRIYLARNAYDGFDPNNADGGFNVIGANGFEPLRQEAPPADATK